LIGEHWRCRNEKTIAGNRADVGGRGLLNELRHEVRVTFDQSGTGHIIVRGRRDHSREVFTVRRSVKVE
jgi:hypothetical protein